MKPYDFGAFGFLVGLLTVIGVSYAMTSSKIFGAESPGQGTGFSGIIGESGSHAASQDANTHVAQYKTTAAGYDVVGLSPDAPSTILKPCCRVPINAINPLIPLIPDAPATILKPCCRVPINAINPLIPLIPDAPFKTVETAFGGNRFGSLSRNSDDDTTMGRFGQLSLPPGLNDGYTDGTSTKTLSEWRQSLDLQRVSDTLFIARSMSGGENISLRRV